MLKVGINVVVNTLNVFLQLILLFFFNKTKDDIQMHATNLDGVNFYFLLYLQNCETFLHTKMSGYVYTV